MSTLKHIRWKKGQKGISVSKYDISRVIHSITEIYGKKYREAHTVFLASGSSEKENVKSSLKRAE